MTKIILSLLLMFGLSACLSGFDEQYQFDQRYPATLEILNHTQHKLMLTSISHSLETQSRFFLEGGKVTATQPLRLRISESIYTAFAEGFFWLDGSCGNIKKWQKKGDAVSRKTTRNQTEWKVSITVDSCD